MIGEVMFFLIYITMSIGFTAFGIYGLRNPQAVTDFFHGAGSRLFGRRFADQVYTQANLRWATIPFVIVGPVFVVLGVAGLVGALSL
jgi:hypothetical protein